MKSIVNSRVITMDFSLLKVTRTLFVFKGRKLLYKSKENIKGYMNTGIILQENILE